MNARGKVWQILFGKRNFELTRINPGTGESLAEAGFARLAPRLAPAHHPLHARPGDTLRECIQIGEHFRIQFADPVENAIRRVIPASKVLSSISACFRLQVARVQAARLGQWPGLVGTRIIVTEISSAFTASRNALASTIAYRR